MLSQVSEGKLESALKSVVLQLQDSFASDSLHRAQCETLKSQEVQGSERASECVAWRDSWSF